MLKVICTIVLINGFGAREVHTVEAIELREVGDNYIIELIEPVPGHNSVQNVNNNDCLYVDDPVKGYQEYLKLQELENERVEADSRAWKEFVRRKRQKSVLPANKRQK